MGDLKKSSRVDYVKDDGLTIEIDKKDDEQIEVMSDQTIERLRTYIKEFYEIQKKKKKEED